MELENTTDYQDYFLRRMVAWVCRQCGHRVKDIRRARFKHARRGFSGRAYGGPHGGFFTARIAKPGQWQPFTDTRHGVVIPLPTREHALVAIAAHEINHLNQFRDGRMEALRRRGSEAVERDCFNREARVVREFDADRDALLAQWNQPPTRIEGTKVTAAVTAAGTL